MATLMAFGTRNRLAWIPCPQSPFEGTVTRRSTASEMRSGALFVATAPMTRRTYNFSWVDKDTALAPVLEMAAENDGPPYYFLHPRMLIDKVNALPPHWAAPGLFGTPDLFTDVYSLVNQASGYIDSTMRTLATTLPGAPTKAQRIHVWRAAGAIPAKNVANGGVAAYVNDAGTYKLTNPSATIVVPPGVTMYVRATGAVSNGGAIGLWVRNGDSNGYFTGTDAVAGTWLTPTLAGATTALAAAAWWRTYDIIVGANPAPSADAYVDLAGLEVYLGVSSFPATFQKGRGQMPLWPGGNDGIATSVYSVVGNKLTSAQWPLTEGYVGW